MYLKASKILLHLSAKQSRLFIYGLFPGSFPQENGHIRLIRKTLCSEAKDRQ
jgi:hypothetical protein